MIQLERHLDSKVTATIVRSMVIRPMSVYLRRNQNGHLKKTHVAKKGNFYD